MPCRGFGSSCLHVLNSSRWAHIAIRSQTLSIVSSHEQVSASPVSSSLEVHNQSFMALSRSFFIIWRATSSVFTHRSICACRAWERTHSVVAYPIPVIFLGVVQGWYAVPSFRHHAVLNPCRQYRSSLSSSLCRSICFSILFLIFQFFVFHLNFIFLYLSYPSIRLFYIFYPYPSKINI